MKFQRGRAAAAASLGNLQPAGSHRAGMRPVVMLSRKDHKIFKDASCQGFNLLLISNLISSGHGCNAVLGHWLSKDLGRKTVAHQLCCSPVN